VYSQVFLEGGAVAGPEGMVVDAGYDGLEMRDADACFIAAANPATVLALVAMVRAARAEGAAPTAAQAAWISVADCLPPVGTEVLVYRPGSDRGKVTALARFIRHEAATDYWWDNAYPGKGNMHLDTSITHWMPLPAPPAAQAAGRSVADAHEALRTVVGCFRAAEVEGLSAALAETADDRLKDLVERRLMYALFAAQDAVNAQNPWAALARKAVDVLRRHAPPDGLSDAGAIAEFYDIFDGPEFRAAQAAEPLPAASHAPHATLAASRDAEFATSGATSAAKLELDRNEILEEAARAVELCYTGLGGPPDDPHPDAVLVNGTIHDCAKAIRALKSV
jgi:hypothetical protein